MQALRAGYRLDGRDALECRHVDFKFSLDGSSCTVKLGNTMVVVSVTARLEQPYSDRQNEGSLRFDVAKSPMADIEVQDTVELGRLIERGFKESRAVDLEALCVQPGRRVWNLYVDACILDNCGNIIDALGLAALAALSSFRRPAVTLDPDAPGGIVIHSPREKEPIPIALHHHPVPITFAFYENGSLMATDPELKEETTAEGTFTVIVTKHRELCAAQKSHGIGISTKQVMQCLHIASERAREIVERMQKALGANEIERVAARVRKKLPAAGVAHEVQVEERGPTVIRPSPSSNVADVVDVQHKAADEGVEPQQKSDVVVQETRKVDRKQAAHSKGMRRMDHKQKRKIPKKRSISDEHDSKKNILDHSSMDDGQNTVHGRGLGDCVGAGDPLEEIARVIAAAGAGGRQGGGDGGDLRAAFKRP